MKIKIKETPDRIELLKKLGSKNRIESLEAAELIAAFITPVAQEVINKAGLSSMIYETIQYNEDDMPSIPLDTFYDRNVGYITVWTQNIAGGMPASQTAGVHELKVSTYELHSAIELLKRYARRSRLDVLSKSITRMLQEVLIKRETNAWAVAIKALAEASTNSLEHVIQANTDSILQVEDFSKLLTRGRRIGAAFDGGTPDPDQGRGVTDLVMSPEMTEQIRSFAYQPMNTRAVPDTTESTAVPLPDNVREDIYRAAGANEIYGISLHEALEFGTSQPYNALFDTLYGGGNMDNANDELIFGFDGTKEGAYRLLARDSETGTTFQVIPDDRFTTREDKIGYYGGIEEGVAVTDARKFTGIIV